MEALGYNKTPFKLLEFFSGGGLWINNCLINFHTTAIIERN